MTALQHSKVHIVRCRLAGMTIAMLGCIASTVSAAPALADDTVPVGWSRSADGTYTHDASGVHCPPQIAGYSLKSIEGASDPNFDGICTYEKAQGEIGLLRVRHYVEGVGETPLAIRNDYGLMHPDQSPQKVVSAFRGGPGPVVDGVETTQFVLTSVSNGYLLDCIARHKTKEMPPIDFPQACSGSPG